MVRSKNLETYSLGYHAGLRGDPSSSAPGDNYNAWILGWQLGADEKQELDEIHDVDGLGSIFEVRD